jgi:hypothetical protein
MPRIDLIVSGEMERVGLGRSLNQVFPDVEFNTQRTDGFTSCKVEDAPTEDGAGPTNAEVMARLLISAVDPGRGVRLPVINDVEIGDGGLARASSKDTQTGLVRLRRRLPLEFIFSGRKAA